MNRAIAVAELDGPDAGLAVLDQFDLDHYYHSTRTDLLRRTGRDTKARQAYQRALELAQTEPERRFSRTGSANQNRDRSRLRYCRTARTVTIRP
jgi:predicted RNA polymerase sigma factor